jgi:LysM repeat protein
MLHRTTLITVCALFCAVAVAAGLFVANLSKQSGPITQQAAAGATNQPTSAVATPSAANTPMPTSAPIAVIDPAGPTATSPAAPTSAIPTQGGVPIATAVPTANVTGYIEYTVQKGDLLNSIAKRHNVTAKDILAINQINNPDSLTVGQVLRIPKV